MILKSFIGRSHGFSLVSVLVIMGILTVIGFSFMRQTAFQAGRITTVEKNLLSILLLDEIKAFFLLTNACKNTLTRENYIFLKGETKSINSIISENNDIVREKDNLYGRIKIVSFSVENKFVDQNDSGLFIFYLKVKDIESSSILRNKNLKFCFLAQLDADSRILQCRLSSSTACFDP